MNWQDKPVLITGAGGFIGSHLAERLAELGAKTRALVHYRSNGSWGWLDDSPRIGEIEVLAGDVRDRDCVAKAMKGREVVFHLAALIGIPYSYDAPGSYISTNITGTTNVLQVALDLGVERMVHTSSSEVYGTARIVPIDEDHPLQAQSPYSATKIAADKLAESFYCSYGLPVATIRPFNTYGPRQSVRAVIPAIIVQALTESVIRLGNLTPTRDFNFVADTVEGFLRVAEHPDSPGQVFNIGSSREISIGDLVALISDLTGKQGTSVVNDDVRVRPHTSEVERLLANSQKARTILCWNPEYTLEEGLVQTIEWIRGRLEQYRMGSFSI